MEESAPLNIFLQMKRARRDTTNSLPTDTGGWEVCSTGTSAKNAGGASPCGWKLKDSVPAGVRKRTLKKNQDIRLEIQSPSIITGEKIDLYRRYLDSKHSDKGDKEIRDYETVLSNIHYGYAHTIEMDYYDCR